MKNPIEKLKAVIFDVDGTLIDDSLHFKKHDYVLCDVLKLPALKLDPSEWDRIRGISDGDAYKYIIEKASRSGVNHAKIPSSHTYIDLANAYFYQHLNQLTLRPGAVDILQAAKQLNLIMGIATNATRHETDKKLEAVTIRNQFVFTSCLDDVLHAKPAPDIYEDAVRKAQKFAKHALSSRSTLALEDTATGVRSALSAGCRVIWWQNENGNYPEISHPYLSTTNRPEVVTEIIGRLAGRKIMYSPEHALK